MFEHVEFRGARGAHCNYTLPGEGVWLLSVIGKYNHTDDNMGSGVRIVHYSDATTNDLLISAELDERHNGVITDLTLGNPTTAGVVTATLTYSGTPTNVGFYFRATKLNSRDNYG